MTLAKTGVSHDPLGSCIIYVKEYSVHSSNMNMAQQLCCILQPDLRCIGCDIPVCYQHWDNNLATDSGPLISLDPCEYKYKLHTWVHVTGNHAFTPISNLEACRSRERDVTNK